MSAEILYDFFLDPDFVFDHLQEGDIVNFFKTAITEKGSSFLVRFPGQKQWRRFFGESRDRITAGCPTEKYALAAEFILKNTRVLERHCSLFDGKKDWFDNYSSEDRRIPIHAVLSDKKDVENENSIINYDSRWESKLIHTSSGSVSIPRQAKAMAQVLKKLFVYSSKILFIDPYFDPSAQRYIKPLGEFLKVAQVGRPQEKGINEIQFHTTVEKTTLGNHGGGYGYSDFCRYARQYLPAAIPAGLSMEILFWKARVQEQEFHNRYILTEHFGVSLGAGLSQNPFSKDNVALMDSSSHEETWWQVRGPNPKYDKAEETILINGTATN